MTDSTDNKDSSALHFEQVLQKELEYFDKWKWWPSTGEKHERSYPPPDEEFSDDYAEAIVKIAHESRLTGLAFSGGGIRSATFNLGVLQTLAKLKLLGHFDYLSTVSGGGYIGSWFTAWVHRARKTEDNSGEIVFSNKGLKDVRRDLKSSVSAAGDSNARAAMQPDPSPIWHLREYSNYLSPKTGLWSTDTWTLGITYIRNLCLTLSLLFTTLVALVLLVRIVTSLYFDSASVNGMIPLISFQYVFLLSICMATILAGYELSGAVNEGSWKLSNFAVFFTMISAVSGSLSLWHMYTLQQSVLVDELMQVFPGDYLPLLASLSDDIKVLILPCFWIAVAVIIGWFFGMFLGGSCCKSDTDSNKSLLLKFLFPVLLCTVLFLSLLISLGIWMKQWLPENATIWAPEHWYIVVWGVPLMVLIYSLAALVFVGISGNVLRELDREWLGRFFAVLSKWTALSTFLVILVVYSPYVILLLGTYLDGLLNLGVTAIWGIFSTAGAYIARNIIIGNTSAQGWVQKIILSIAPYVFILGMIVLTVWVTELGIAWTHTLLNEHVEHLTCDDYWYLISHMNLPLLSGILLFTIAFMILWSRRIGVNRFSLHSMYADRLIRAYLGASNLNRKAHPFTGFSEKDNEIRMGDLVRSSDTSSKLKKDDLLEPYLIINAAINLVDSKRLAWQKRKAASFTFTPQYCGYEFCGESSTATETDQGARCIREGRYIKSACYAGDKSGISLGKAMSISGAAASPNMGYHSSPALTFLMTTFNVRLGWWLPNTGLKKLKHAAKGEPKWGLLYLWNELLGKTNAESDYVYLSDGGHFENLGIYELVRRRCYIIVACDAEADPKMTFSGLGNAIEKCQIDLGVPIDIDVSQLRPDPESGKSAWHCAVGCIRYSEADSDQPDGILVYIKSSLTGDEPLGVETYASSNKEFPHESTVDQWFDESQFESYRALGEHITQTVLGSAVSIARAQEVNKKDIIDRTVMELHKQWYAGSDTQDSAPVDHNIQLESILDTLRSDSHLEFLDGQLYPNLKKVAETNASYRKRDSLPADYEEYRAGFYFCKRLIQFMQKVYYDRRLDMEHSAPRNRGWMNLFRRWSWSQMLRFTWTMTAGTYGSRFQTFCEYRLGLDSGELILDDKPLSIEVTRSDKSSADEQSNDDDETTDKQFILNSGKEKPIDWTSIQKNYGFHYDETQIIRKFLIAYSGDDIWRTRDKLTFNIYPFKLTTNDPTSSIDDKSVKLNVGFVISGPVVCKGKKKSSDTDRKQTVVNKVLYFRIRPSMRNMDLARKAVKACMKHDDLKDWNLEDLKIKADSKMSKAYPDVYSLEKESICYCRWLSRLLEDDDVVNSQPESK